MNCLESRRALLVSSRYRSIEHDAHLAECDVCRRLLERVADLNREIADAALVAVPDALVERILLSHRRRPEWHYAAAALLLLGSFVLALAVTDVIDASDLGWPVVAVGPMHAGIAAISFVLDDQSEMAQDERPADRADMENGLKRLGLSFQAPAANARYVGKCHLQGSECDHLVVKTPDGAVNVMLMPDYAVEGRVLVADRRLVALVSPAPAGGYIIVAESRKAARRTEKLFRRG